MRGLVARVPVLRPAAIGIGWDTGTRTAWWPPPGGTSGELSITQRASARVPVLLASPSRMLSSSRVPRSGNRRRSSSPAGIRCPAIPRRGAPSARGQLGDPRTKLAGRATARLSGTIKCSEATSGACLRSPLRGTLAITAAVSSPVRLRHRLHWPPGMQSLADPFQVPHDRRVVVVEDSAAAQACLA